MKVAASDYDGTLFRGGRVSAADLAAIRRWRAAGHRFGLATARDTNLCLPEFYERGVEFDFAVCGAGATIYALGPGGALETLRQLGLPPDAAGRVLGQPAMATAEHWTLYRGDTTYIVTLGDDSRLRALGFALSPLSPGEAMALTGCRQLSCEFSSTARAAAAAAELRASCGGDMAIHQGGHCLDVTAPGVSKAEGVEAMLRLTGWVAETVLAFGDTESDVPMFRRFRGYAMDIADEAVQRQAGGVCASPGEVLLANL